MKCAVCKGTVQERLIRYVQDYKGQLIIIENVPAQVCGQCGERLLRPEVATRIQELVWDGPAPQPK